MIGVLEILRLPRAICFLSRSEFAGVELWLVTRFNHDDVTQTLSTLVDRVSARIVRSLKTIRV